ncbi:MAG: hypothetical protein RIB59_01210 [Rhodospirillales bacterium]
MTDLSVDEFHAALDAERVARRHSGPDGQKPPPVAGGGASGEIDGERHLFGEDGFTFADLLDIINPLQHIPIVSTIYRELSGDKIAMLPRILGGALFGGPIGAGAAVANAVVEQGTGRDLGEHVVALFTGDEAPVTAVAQAASKDAAPAEAAMTTAAGPTAAAPIVNASRLATVNPLRQGDSSRAFTQGFTEPAQAELDILEAEAATGLAAPNAQQARAPARPAAPGQIAAQRVPVSHDRPGPDGIAEPTAAEKLILATEAAFARLEANRITPQQALTVAAETPPAQPLAAKLPVMQSSAVQSSAAEITAANDQAVPRSLDTVESPSQWFTFSSSQTTAPPPQAAAPRPQAAAPQPKTTAQQPVKVPGTNRLASYMDAMTQQRAPAAAPSTQPAPQPAPQGAVALQGGWFSDVMLTALNKYEQGKMLKQPAARQTVNQLN